MSIEREMTLNDYVNIIKRRLMYVVGFFLLVFFSAVVIALKLPPVYQSTGTILIESQQVQSDLSKEKYATDRFEALKQVVLSKENLFNIAEKYKLYGLNKNPNISPTRIAQAAQSNIMVDLLRADAGQWGEKATFAFEVSFKHNDSDDTYNVTKDLIELFLAENDRASKARVTETAEFYSKEAAKQKIALETIEKAITEYKRSHSNSLPENKVMQIGSIERLENDLRATQREYSTTQAELRSLDVSLESAKAGIGLNTPQELGTGASELDKLKLELAKQSAIYSPNHPSIRALQRRIDLLEKSGTAAESTAPVKSITAQSMMVAKVQAQIDTANARLKSLEAEEQDIRVKIGQTEGRVIQSSQTEGALSTLLRDYDNAKFAYAEIKTKQDNSKLAKNIEMENKGERFVLVEAPLLPEKPIKPNRLLIILAGFIGAIFSAIGLAVLMESFDKRIRGVDALAAIMKIQPIATIPYITTKAELKYKKLVASYIMYGTLIVTLLVLLLVHLFVMPLDEIVTKILAKF